MCRYFKELSNEVEDNNENTNGYFDVMKLVEKIFRLK